MCAQKSAGRGRCNYSSPLLSSFCLQFRQKSNAVLKLAEKTSSVGAMPTRLILLLFIKVTFTRVADVSKANALMNEEQLCKL